MNAPNDAKDANSAGYTPPAAAPAPMSAAWFALQIENAVIQQKVAESDYRQARAQAKARRKVWKDIGAGLDVLRQLQALAQQRERAEQVEQQADAEQRARFEADLAALNPELPGEKHEV